MSGSLSDIRHLVFLSAERIPAADLPGLAGRATECPAYHLTPAGEDRAELWGRYATALTTAGFTVALGGTDAAASGGRGAAGGLATGVTADVAAGVTASATADTVAAALIADALPEVTAAEVDADGLRRVLDALDRAPRVAAKTLVAIALAGGDALPVSAPEGTLGAPGALFLLSPWTPGRWVSEEVFDHTSLLRLCERWTAAREREVRAELPAWRRALCGDLLRVIDLREPDEIGPLPEVAGRRLARPVPYFSVAELRLGETGASVRLGNLGPVATSSAPFTVDDGVTVSALVVAGSPIDDQELVRVPVAVRDGAYDVTVLGPNHFRRRFAGSVPDAGVRCEVEYFGRDPWFPSLTLTVSHELTMPVFFWLERRLGERAASKALGYGTGTLERLPGPRQTARFKEEPGANTFGWYDVAVTTSADPAWVREYSGHLPTGIRPTLAY